MNHPAKWLIVITILSLHGGAIAAGKDIAAPKNALTASQLEGTWIATWKAKSGMPRIRKEIRMLALDKHQLKAEFYGEYNYIDPSGERALNVGIAIGTASIDSSVVSFDPRHAAEAWGCKISMTRRGLQLVVTQQEECGFGSHVHADGTYHRESRIRPTFTETFWNEQ
jgi:hypothetical protein